MKLAKEKSFHEYSQRNEHCKRPIGVSAESEARSEFQRDYEQIIHAKSFRRLVDKAQIFSSSKGDHYRTRMTHTLEVARIARYSRLFEFKRRVDGSNSFGARFRAYSIRTSRRTHLG